MQSMRSPWAFSGILCFGFLLLFGRAWADGRTVSMAGCATAVARGVEAGFWNPAILAMDPVREARLLGVSAGLGNSAFTRSEYAAYNGEYLSEEDKEAILEAVDSDALNVAGWASGGGPGISMGHWSISARLRSGFDASLPVEVFELAFYGNPVGETVEIKAEEAAGYAAAELDVSYGARLPGSAGKALWWGLSVNVLTGLGYAHVTEATAKVTTTNDLLYGDGAFEVTTARGGRGFSFDLGLAGDLGGGFQWGAAVRDLGGWIEWTGDVQEQVGTVSALGLRLDQLDDAQIVDEVTTRPLESVRMHVPAVWSLGLARSWARGTASIEVSAASCDGFGASRRLRMALGGERNLSDWLVLRGGFSVGGTEGPSVACGVGLHLWRFRLDVGTASWDSLNPFDSKGLLGGLTVSYDL